MWFDFLPENKSIRKTIINVVALYLTTTILLVLTLGFGYIYIQKEQLFNTQKEKVDYQANQIIKKIEDLHEDFLIEDIIIYPEFVNIKSAIYDINKDVIFATYGMKNIDFTNKYFYKNDMVYFIYPIEPYYLGAAYLVIEKSRDKGLKSTFITLGISLFFIILVLIFTSFFLARMLIRPLSDNINLLDKFIKDTTHELNTPVSAILGNIEMIDIDCLEQKTRKKINRIKIATTTISNIYNDLSFLILNNKEISKNENINLSELISSRIEYFKILSDSKRLAVDIDIIQDVFLVIDRLKATRLIDNILSNAIKYSKINTSLTISLGQYSFSIEDQGIGMKQEDIEYIFERYKRFDDSVGGFGIGYNIVYSILKEYQLQIDIQSKVDLGTKVTVSW